MKKINMISQILLLVLLNACFFDEEIAPLPDLIESDLIGCWLIDRSSINLCKKTCFDESGSFYSLTSNLESPIGVPSSRSSEQVGNFVVNGAISYQEGPRIITMPGDELVETKVLRFYLPSNDDDPGELIYTPFSIEETVYVDGDKLMHRYAANEPAKVLGTRMKSMNSDCHESWYHFQEPAEWTLE